MTGIDLVEIFGTSGVIIAGLVAWGMMERRERLATQKKFNEMVGEQTRREVETGHMLTRILEALGSLRGAK